MKSGSGVLGTEEYTEHDSRAILNRWRGAPPPTAAAMSAQALYDFCLSNNVMAAMNEAFAGASFTAAPDANVRPKGCPNQWRFFCSVLPF